MNAMLFLFEDDNRGLTRQPPIVTVVRMTAKTVTEQDRGKFHQLREVRIAALEHARRAQQLSTERRGLITELINLGYSQSDIAREMGVSRQAVQKMLSLR